MTDNSKNEFLFHQGTSRRAYEYMGMHNEGDRAIFRVWAPNAEAVYVVGSFNGWDESCPMRRVTERGIWEASIGSDEVKAGDIYKYKIKNNGREIFKSDPYGVRLDTPPSAASVIYDIEKEYNWHDEGWLEHRRALMGNGCFDKPMNIYELHLGSWKRHEDGSYFSYKELADDKKSRAI